jgi:hypothetical protein
MQPLLPHGVSRRLLSLLGDGISIDLLGYADGSFGIDRDGQTIGNWPAAEEEECVKVFYNLGELHTSEPCFLISRETFRVAQAAAIAAQANLN